MWGCFFGFINFFLFKLNIALFNVFLFFNFSFNTSFFTKNNKNFNYFFIFIILYKFFKKIIQKNNLLLCKIYFLKKNSHDFVLLKAPFRNKQVKHILKKIKSRIVLNIFFSKKNNLNVQCLDGFFELNTYFLSQLKAYLIFFFLPGFQLTKVKWTISSVFSCFFFFKNLNKSFNLFYLLKKRYLFFSK